MKRSHRTRILLTLFTVAVTALLLAVSAFAEKAQIGENDLWWEYDEASKTLTITGTETEFPSDICPSFKGGKGQWWTDITDRNVPWKDSIGSIENIEISAPITTVPAAFFRAYVSLKSVGIPAEMTTLEARAFGQCDKLTCIYITGTEKTENVFDLRNIVKTLDQTFIRSGPKGTNITVLTTNKTSGVSINKDTFYDANGTNASFTLKTVAGGAYDTTVFGNDPDIVKEYYTDDEIYEYFLKEYEVLITNSKSDGTGADRAKWSFDYETKTLTITEVNSLWTPIDYGATDYLALWKPYIETINGGKFNKFQIYYDGLFSDMPNLKKVVFEYSDQRFTAKKNLFKNCTSLTTLYFGTGEDGVIDFTNMSSNKDDNPSGFMETAFVGCTSIKAIKLPTHASYTTIKAATFASGNTSLTKVYVPSNITSVETGAFASLPSGAKIICENGTVKSAVEASVLPEGITATCPSEIPEDFKKALSFVGFQIRLTEKNGLRARFAYDKTAVNDGRTLKEFGTLTKAGTESITLDTTGTVVKNVVWNKNDGFVANNYGDSFVLSVVNITEANYTSKIKTVAYEIWEDAEGTEEIRYTDSDAMSLYDATIGMYRDGAVNASNDTESIAWNTLINSDKFVTIAESDLTVDSEAVYLNGYTGGDLTLNGIQMYSATPATAITGLKAYAFTDYSGDYVLIYHLDNGVESAKLAENLAWNKNTQLGSTYWEFKTANSTETKAELPHPMISDSAFLANSKLKYVVLDRGISGGGYTFVRFKAAEQIVYDDTCKTLGTYGTFQDCEALTTVYPASYYQANRAKPTIMVGEKEYPIIEISSLDSFSFDCAFIRCYNVRFIHAPENIGGGTDKPFFSTTNLLGFYVGNRTPEIGVIDLSTGTHKTVSGTGGNFVSSASVNTVILPDSCTSITGAPFNAVTTVKQAVRNAGVASWCAENGVSYTDLDGNAHTAG